VSTILLIRHGEKPDTQNQGVTETGAADDRSLTVRGWQRAGALASLFGASGGPPAPSRIYASGSTKRLKSPDEEVGSKSERSSETVSVLAAKLQLAVIDKFSKGEEAALVTEVTLGKGTTLGCWQHEEIPKIAALILGRSGEAPASWSSNRFDVVWRLVRPGAGQAWSFDQVCQRLLPGDESKPIS
jgi:broad specificity phosphatase PhoE